MTFYFTIHALLLCFVIFEFSKKPKVKDCVLLIWVLFFTILGGFRWEVGSDWDQYYYYFENCSIFETFDTVRYGNDYLEPGFVVLSAISKAILQKYYIYNLFLTFFYQITIYKISKRYSPNYPILMYVFIMTLTGVGSYGAVRAGLAAAIIYWSYQYIEQRDLKRFLLIVFIASSIHVLALVILPFYWAGKIKFNYLNATILYFVVAYGAILFQNYFTLLSLLIGGNIATKTEVYSVGETEGVYGGSSYGWVLYYLLFMLFIYMRKYYQNQFFYNSLLVLYFVLRSIMMVFSEGMGDLTRLGSGLGPVFPILFMFAVTQLLETPNVRVKWLGLLIFSAVTLFNYNRICDGYYFEDAYVPYKTIFDYDRLDPPQWSQW